MKKQFLRDMATLQALSEKYDAQVSALCAVGFSNEAPVFDAADRAIMFAVDMIADKYGFTRNSMNWFVFENKFGAEGFKCSSTGGKLKPIRTAADFWRHEKGGDK